MHRLMICAVGLLLLLGTEALAQEKSLPPTAAEKESAARPVREPDGVVPLTVTVTISRVQGDKKVSTMPYVLGVAANSQKTTLRMGVDVPVPMGGAAGGGVSYRSVGTTIDCEARSAAQAGIYRLFITVTDTAVGFEADGPAAARAQNMPNFRTFNSSFVALLREGQTSQYTSATDPVTGEMMRVDVTLNAMK